VQACNNVVNALVLCNNPYLNVRIGKSEAELTAALEVLYC